MMPIGDVKKRSVWYVDGGGAKDNESFGKICIIKDEQEPVIMDVLIKSVTNNTTEYIACRGALKSCEDGDVIYTDSQLVVGQLTKGWSVNFGHLQILHDECEQIMKTKKVTLVWIPRDKNKAGIVLEKSSGDMFTHVVGNKVEVVGSVDDEADRSFMETAPLKLLYEINEFKKASKIKEVEEKKEDLGIEF
jgi:ribonuclease HI